MASVLQKIRASKAEKKDSVPEMSQISTNNLPLMGPTTPGEVTPGGNPMSGFGFHNSGVSSPHGSVLPSVQTPYTPDAGTGGSSVSWIGQREAFSIMASHLHKISRSKWVASTEEITFFLLGHLRFWHGADSFSLWKPFDCRNWFSEDPNVASGVVSSTLSWNFELRWILRIRLLNDLASLSLSLFWTRLFVLVKGNTSCAQLQIHDWSPSTKLWQYWMLRLRSRLWVSFFTLRNRSNFAHSSSPIPPPFHSSLPRLLQSSTRLPLV